MSQAKSVDSTTLPVDDPGNLLALARQNANRTTSIKALRRLRHEASAEIHRLIAFLDASDPYVMTELEDDDERERIGDEEPSLGSFDRMRNQEKSYRQQGGCFDTDAEQDDCDREDDDPDEAKDQPLEMGGAA